MSRSVCIHAHFYQPPRENPWLEEIELQDSAYPFHDWNERITQECYAANASSRILDEEGRIVSIVNNYERVSFNFGPTVLSWLEHHDPITYEAIIEGDRRSRERFSGHGSALAQPYNHMIMPLATARDKRAQLIWGLHDFRRRFGRDPEGMWLPESAVDLETLDLMSALGVAFTILAPGQARRVRAKGEREWTDVAGGAIDPTRPYEQRLPSGRSIAIFFYDGPISQGVAFEGLLTSGERFAERLMSGFSEQRDWDQLVHIATDGETYGHHHRHGDMALAYTLQQIENDPETSLTNYGERLGSHPPEMEVEIIENTSWSCAHGVERWRNDCGCTTGGRPGWTQAWRKPLREALDWLRDEITDPFETAAAELFSDPWQARDDYIQVVLDRSSETIDGFLSRCADHKLNPTERQRALKLLELQRHAMLMYTSCGWFFDELSRVETVQVLQYAGRALQLARELFGRDFEQGFLDRLAEAWSNVPEHGDGRRVYETFVRPAIVDLAKVGAHYALSSLFQEDGRRDRVFCYTTESDEYRSEQAGRARLAIGRVRVASTITEESADLTFAAAHFGEQMLTGGVRAHQGMDAHRTMSDEIADAFFKADFVETVRRLDRHFPAGRYSVNSLFRDEQRRILRLILDSTLEHAEEAYRRLFEDYYPLMRFVGELGAPLPKALRTAAEFVIDTDLRRMFESGEITEEETKWRLQAAHDLQLELDAAGLSFALQRSLERCAERLRQTPDDIDAWRALDSAVDLARHMPFEVDFWRTQNMFYEVVQSTDTRTIDHDGEPRKTRSRRIRELGEKLSVRVETVE